ncbi:hypothetical protein WICMUC_003846 [Wickerhamomyces mucosus]|uniref:Uncharacterized protein n=1 Tax=Wickerhamomyces mucosus TaxID=1378264 RepID=A0A9P8PJW3_9ASCO|nr:hypothetical protein WICMUC_003846 [Wickerhamomyces mucosus]
MSMIIVDEQDHQHPEQSTDYNHDFDNDYDLFISTQIQSRIDTYEEEQLQSFKNKTFLNQFKHNETEKNSIVKTSTKKSNPTKQKIKKVKSKKKKLSITENMMQKLSGKPNKFQNRNGELNNRDNKLSQKKGGNLNQFEEDNNKYINIFTKNEWEKLNYVFNTHMDTNEYNDNDNDNDHNDHNDPLVDTESLWDSARTAPYLKSINYIPRDILPLKAKREKLDDFNVESLTLSQFLGKPTIYEDYFNDNDLNSVQDYIKIDSDFESEEISCSEDEGSPLLMNLNSSNPIKYNEIEFKGEIKLKPYSLNNKNIQIKKLQNKSLVDNFNEEEISDSDNDDNNHYIFMINRKN